MLRKPQAIIPTNDTVYRPILLIWINSNPRMVKYYIHYGKWEEITYPFPSCHGATVEDLE